MIIDKIKPKSYKNDRKYINAIKFAKNKHLLTNSDGLSNLYIINKFDKDGNPCGEYYGENLVTDYAMTHFFINNESFPTNFYIGSGVGSFDKTTSSLLTPLTQTSATITTSTIAYNYPMYYDSASHLITCIAKYMDCYFDYNISGITNDISITEYGIGTSTTALWTHSYVYDITGAQTTITKNINERLVITVFMCLSYYDTLITDNYTNDIHTIITSPAILFENRMYENTIGTFKSYNYTSRAKSNTSSGFMKNSITRYTNMSTFTFNNDTSDAGGYVDGFYQCANGYLLMEPQYLPTPENISYITPMPTYMGKSSNSSVISTIIGKRSYGMPYTRISDVKLSLFNHKTNDWYEENITYDNNNWYSEMPFSTSFAVPIYYTNNNEVLLMYVYNNLAINNPIDKLIDPNFQTVYVTDKYWDVSSWNLITDHTNIPTELQTMRYWITPTNTVSLTPHRTLNTLKIIPQGRDTYTTLAMSGVTSIYTDRLTNPDYGWYLIGSKLYSVTNKVSYALLPTSSLSTKAYCYDKYLIQFASESNASRFFITNTSDLSSTPLTTEYAASFSSHVTLGDAYISETGTGIFGITDSFDTTKEFVSIDIRNNTVVQTKYTANNGTCIWGTSKIAYIPTDTPNVIRVYDIDTSSVSIDLTLPSNCSNPVAMVGHTNYLWITNGTTITYVYNILTGTMTLCDGFIYETANNGKISNFKLSIVDDVIIAYDNNHYYYPADTNKSGNFITLNNPTTIHCISELGSLGISSVTNNVQYNLQYLYDKTLILHIINYQDDNNYYTTLVDFGLYLSTSVTKYNIWGYNSWAPTMLYGNYLLKSNAVCDPIEYYIEHKFECKTSTITSANNIKQISGKQWSHTITNSPEFNGTPPGKSN